MGRYAEAFLDYPFQLSELLDEFKDGELEITRPARGLRRGGRQGPGEREPPGARPGRGRADHRLGAIIAVFAHSTDVAGLSLIAIPGFIVAGVLVAWLCVGIFRSGRW